MIAFFYHCLTFNIYPCLAVGLKLNLPLEMLLTSFWIRETPSGVSVSHRPLVEESQTNYRGVKTQELTSYLNPSQTLPPYSVFGQTKSWTVVLMCRSSVSLTGSGVSVQLGPMFEGGALKTDTSLSSYRDCCCLNQTFSCQRHSPRLHRPPTVFWWPTGGCYNYTKDWTLWDH